MYLISYSAVQCSISEGARLLWVGVLVIVGRFPMIVAIEPSPMQIAEL